MLQFPLSPARRSGQLALAAVAAAALLVGCSSPAPAPADTAAPTAPLADLVPADFADGVINGVVGDNNPPIYMRGDDNSVVGLSSELALAAAEQLGLKVNLEVQPFDTVIPGLQAAKYDIGLYGTDVRPERLEILDMVSWHAGGYGLLAYGDDAKGIGDEFSDLCGLAFGGISGSAGIAHVQKASDDCVAAGDPAMDVREFKDQAAALLATQSGQLDAAIISVLTGAYTAQQEPSWTMVGPRFGVVPIAMAFTKGNGLAEAFAEAINALIADGTYEAIFAKYGVEVAMVDEALVNPTN